MSAKDAKIAAAPISWGVCEVPGWGHQMSPERVLKEMSDLGFTATEFGPLGFLPIDPAIKAAILKEHGMTATGGFYPAILHRADHDPIPAVKVELESYIASGANVLVLAANSGIDGYDAALPVLTDAEWEILFKNLDAIKAVAAEVGVQTVLHPHVGTMVETYDHVMRVADWTDSLRDLVTTLLETNLTIQGNRMNMVMKKVTSWAAIIAVPTAITGWFGQNVPYVGFSQEIGVWLSGGSIVVVSAVLYWAFKRNDWL